MITDLPLVIRRLQISDAVIEVSKALLGPYRTNQLEACLLWFGYVLDETTCIVTTCVLPRQLNHATSYSIPAPYMKEVRRLVRPQNLLLVLQAHTHPRNAYFSKWDEENALNKAPGALNLVIPNYGAADWIDPTTFCMVEMDDAGKWVPWQKDDWQRLNVVPAACRMTAP